MPILSRPLRAFLLLLVFGVFSSFSLYAQLDRPSSAAMPVEVPVANFNGEHVGALNQAHRLLRGGRLEEALWRYDAVAGQFPNWVPALVGKAEVLTRMGRDTEARKMYDRSRRIDPTVTDLLYSKGRQELLRFLALYPTMDLDDEAITESLVREDFNNDNFFAAQYLYIESLPDSLAISAPLRAKIKGDPSTAARHLRDLERDERIDPAILQLVAGNLRMVNHDYIGAVAQYNRGMQLQSEKWPEFYYNRGLAFVLMDKYTNGCADLRVSALAGFTPADALYYRLCNF